VRESIKDLLRRLAETLPVAEPIVEFGSLQVAGQEGFADLRPFFPGKQYLGADMREGPGVDRVLNLHDIDLPDGYAGTVLIIDTLEHVEFPQRAMGEVARILRPGGMVVATSVMDFPIHDHPHDYWRFTPDGFRTLLRPFRSSLVEYAGEPDKPHTVLGVAFKGDPPPEMTAFLRGLQEWQKQYTAPPLPPSVAAARRSRPLWRNWARGLGVLGLLGLGAWLASRGQAAGLVLSGVVTAGLAYALGYRETRSARRRRTRAALMLPLLALVLLVPALGPQGLGAFPLWWVGVGAVASLAAYGAGRVAGRRRRRQREAVPASAAYKAPRQAIIDAFCRLYVESGVYADAFWLGMRALKCPLDLWVYQEIIHELRPDVIIETGTCHGGSAFYLASICDLVGNGRIITVDIESQEGRPQHPRVTYITGSSTALEVIAQVSGLIRERERVMVILDSDHSRAHVLNELRTYQRFVTPGSYLIVEDTVVNHPVFPDHGPGPMEALEEFLAETADLTPDRSREKFHFSFNPKGYLKKAQ